MGPTRAGGAQTQTGGTRTDVIVKALTVEDLRLELQKFHELLLEDFGRKVTAAVQEMKDYVDGEIGIVISRIEKVEAASAEALGPAELVVQRLPKSDDENPPNLINKIASIFRAMGLDSIHIIRAFRMGRSDNPRYVPIVQVFVENKEQLKTVLRHASRLKNSEFDGVFIRESLPAWVREQDYNIRQLARESGLEFRRGRVQPRGTRDRDGV